MLQPGDLLRLGEKRTSLYPMHKSNNILLNLYYQLTLKWINRKLYMYSSFDARTQMSDVIHTTWCLMPAIDSIRYLSDVIGGCM